MSSCCHLPEPAQEVRDLVRSSDPNVVVAGHYSLAPDMEDLSNEGEAEMMSFALGAALVGESVRAGTQSRLVLWVNDIGIPTDRRAELKERYELPENYRDILSDARLDESRLVTLFESTMRNKASVLLRKLYKRKPELFERVDPREEGLVRCVNDSRCELPGADAAYVVKGPEGGKLVVKDGPNPKCNLILATFFQELTRKFRPELLVNVFNELYSYRLELGIHVSRSILENTVPFLNVFCDGEDSFWESHAGHPGAGKTGTAGSMPSAIPA